MYSNRNEDRYGDRDLQRYSQRRRGNLDYYRDRNSGSETNRGYNRDDSHVTSRVVYQVPKNLHFNGKECWVAFKSKFLHFREEFEWNDRECLSCLISCLTGAALELYANSARSVDFWSLMRILQTSYGDQESYELSMANFNVAEQRSDETLQQWADHVRRLGAKAFRKSDGQIERDQVIQRFCMGAHEKSIGRDVFVRDRPRSVVEAMNLIQRELSINMLFPSAESKRSTRVLRMMTSEDSGSEIFELDEDDPRVRAFQSAKNFSKFKPKGPATESKTETPKPDPGKAEDMKISLSELFKLLGLDNRKQDRKPREPIENIKCYNCQEKGHYKRDCPKLASNLNETAAEDEAKSRSKD